MEQNLPPIRLTPVGATLVVALLGGVRCAKTGDHKGRPYGLRRLFNAARTMPTMR